MEMSVLLPWCSLCASRELYAGHLLLQPRASPPGPPPHAPHPQTPSPPAPHLAPSPPPRPARLTPSSPAPRLAPSPPPPAPRPQPPPDHAPAFGSKEDVTGRPPGRFSCLPRELSIKMKMWPSLVAQWLSIDI